MNERQLFSLHGRVLLYIHRHPGLTAADIAHGLHLNPGTIWGTIGGLRKQGMVTVERKRRRHHYYVNPDATLRHPAVQTLRLGNLLAGISAS